MIARIRFMFTRDAVLAIALIATVAACVLWTRHVGGKIKAAERAAVHARQLATESWETTGLVHNRVNDLEAWAKHMGHWPYDDAMKAKLAVERDERFARMKELHEGMRDGPHKDKSAEIMRKAFHDKFQ